MEKTWTVLILLRENTYFCYYIKMSFQLGGNRLDINSLSSTFCIHPFTVYSSIFSE